MKNSILKRAILDDGCNPELVVGAVFDGILEIPTIKAPKRIDIPEIMVPFTQRKRVNPAVSCLTFCEDDKKFASILQTPEIYVDEFKQFDLIMSPDASMYRDAPLAAQITNLYRNRAVGFYYQQHGSNVIPLVRWGNELTYTTNYFPEKIAFLGVEKHSPVAIGPYGCVKSSEDKMHFENGLMAMLETLEPEMVFVYGSMPQKIFNKVKSMTQFVCYPDWTTFMHGGGING